MMGSQGSYNKPVPLTYLAPATYRYYLKPSKTQEHALSLCASPVSLGGRRVARNLNSEASWES